MCLSLLSLTFSGFFFSQHLSRSSFRTACDSLELGGGTSTAVKHHWLKLQGHPDVRRGGGGWDALWGVCLTPVYVCRKKGTCQRRNTKNRRHKQYIADTYQRAAFHLEDFTVFLSSSLSPSCPVPPHQALPSSPSPPPVPLSSSHSPCSSPLLL